MHTLHLQIQLAVSMKGWEVYAPDWGSEQMMPIEADERECVVWIDIFFQNTVYMLNILVPDGPDTCFQTDIAFIRQPEPKDSAAERLRVHNCAKVVQRQWLQALYNPRRQICNRLLLKDFESM